MLNDFFKAVGTTILDINRHQNLGLVKDDFTALTEYIHANQEALITNAKACLAEVQNDVKEANFGLQSKTLTVLQKSVFAVSYKEAQVKMAKYLLKQALQKQVI
jgi:hypothetical protein